MQYVTFPCGLRVSKLCFGSLTVGPLQANLPLEQGASVIAYGLQKGINFIDTAQYYRNYAYLKRAIEISHKFDTVISTKTYAYTRQMAIDAVEEARTQLNRDVIDIFMLHEQESIHTLKGHMEALEYLFECREKGIVRAVGASTHHIALLNGMCTLSEEKNLKFDVVHPIYNLKGLGIADGTVLDMQQAMTRVKEKEIAVFTMKALGGGHLHTQAADALNFVLDTACVDAVAIGMQSIEEVDANIHFFEQREFSKENQKRLDQKKRTLFIEEDCIGCGKCVTRCGQNALKLISDSEGTHCVCDTKKCVLCGYCSGVCDLFAIKVL